jgi:hypothetical protein
VRISLKLFDKTLADMPSDLRQQLTGWLRAAPASLEGYLRPGCLHLTVQLLLEPAAAQEALEHGLERLLGGVAAKVAHPCWREGMLLLQVGRCSMQ